MAESKDNLDQQLDALLDQTQQPASEEQSGKVTERAANASAGASGDDQVEDLMGAQFADQVQQMLDEAKSELSGAGQGNDGAEAGVKSKEPASEADLIGQIDKMLAQQADETLEGQFESVDELLADEKPTDHAVAAQAALEEKTAPADDAALTEKARAVGAELDADAALAGDDDDASHMESIDEMFPGEDDPSSVLNTNVADEQTAGEQATGRKAPKRPVEPGIVRVLRALNRPLAGLPDMWRDVVGFCGVQTALLAVIWMSFLTGGFMVGLPVMSVATVGGYFLFRRLFMT